MERKSTSPNCPDSHPRPSPTFGSGPVALFVGFALLFVGSFLPGLSGQEYALVVKDSRPEVNATGSASAASFPTGVQEVVELAEAPSGELLAEQSEKFHWVLQSDTRSLRSANVARSGSAEQAASAVETTVVARLEFPVLSGPARSTFTPSVTALWQRAWFGRFAVDGADSVDSSLQALDYDFRSGSLGGEFALASGWKLSANASYDELHDFHAGDKLYHAVAPSLAIGRSYALGSGYLNFDVSVTYAFTKIYRSYQVAGQFDDAGDNLRSALNLALLLPLDDSGYFFFTPSLSLMRSAYDKGESIGRVDYLGHGELALVCRFTSWLYIRAFGNYQDKRGNEKAKTALGDSAEYVNWDAGLGISASFRF